MNRSHRTARRPGKHVPLVEPLEGRLLMAVFAVTNTNDTGAGSLRAAIDQSNNTPGLDTITFNISAADKTIRPTAGLVLYDAAILDATTQPGYAGQPLVRIDAASAGTTDGIKLYGSSTIKDLT